MVTSAALFVTSPSGVLAALAHQFEQPGSRITCTFLVEEVPAANGKLREPANYHGPGWALAWPNWTFVIFGAILALFWGGAAERLFFPAKRSKGSSTATTFYPASSPLGTANPDIQCLLA